VDIRELKRFAFESLPPGCPLRETLLYDRDELDLEEFLIKMEVWQKLMKVRGSHTLSERETRRDGRKK